MSQIVFNGCSYTWGSGLEYYYFIKNGFLDYDDLHNYTPDKVRLEKFPKKAQDYRKKHHYPNLVAEHFDVSYVMGLDGNGGDNQLIAESIRDTQHYHYQEVQVQIVQLSAPLRGPNSPILKKKNVKIDEIIKFQVEKVLEYHNGRYYKQKPQPIYFICWYKEHSDYIKKVYPDKLIPILFENKEYSSFDELIKTSNREKRLTIQDDFGIDDHHFSKKGHKVVANSIIKKLSEDVEFELIKI